MASKKRNSECNIFIPKQSIDQLLKISIHSSYFAENEVLKKLKKERIYKCKIQILLGAKKKKKISG